MKKVELGNFTRMIVFVATISTISIFSCHDNFNPIKEVRSHKDLIRLVEKYSITDTAWVLDKYNLGVIDSSNHYFNPSENLYKNQFSLGDFDDDGNTDLIYHEFRSDYFIVPFILKYVHSDSISKLRIVSANPTINGMAIFAKNEKEILFYQYDYDGENESSRNSVDTLEYRYSRFLNKIFCPSRNKIKHIDQKSFPGWAGTIDSISINLSNNKFTLEINDFDSLFTYSNYDLDENLSLELGNIFESINICNLKPKYTAPWSDDETLVTKLTLDNDEIIVVEDYGRSGPKSLTEFYKIIDKVKKNARNTAPPSTGHNFN